MGKPLNIWKMFCLDLFNLRNELFFFRRSWRLGVLFSDEILRLVEFPADLSEDERAKWRSYIVQWRMSFKEYAHFMWRMRKISAIA